MYILLFPIELVNISGFETEGDDFANVIILL